MSNLLTVNVSTGERATETGETRWEKTEQGAQTGAQTAWAGDGQRAEQTQWRHVSVWPQGESQQTLKPFLYTTKYKDLVNWTNGFPVHYLSNVLNNYYYNFMFAEFICSKIVKTVKLWNIITI